MNFSTNGYEEEEPPQLTQYGRPGYVQRRVAAVPMQQVQVPNQYYDNRYMMEQPMYEEYYEADERYVSQYPGTYIQQPMPRYSISQTSISQGTMMIPQEPSSVPSRQYESIDVTCPDESLRASPVIFEEHVPGAWEEIVKERMIQAGKTSTKSRTELDATDVKLVNELGQLSVDHLLDYVKNLQNNAFLLGEEETKEFQRTKCINVFQK
uniref:Uncharacterized protein n=1 Tax=Panagrolaimus sp. JU765 TaxID=591449 RepID=A0AC34RCV8_9BILA